MYVLTLEESLKRLSTAIIEQACYDYIIYSEQLNRYAEKNSVSGVNETLGEIRSLIDWFNSEDFRCITSMNPKKILEGLDKAVEKGVTIDGIYSEKGL